MTFTERH